MTFVFGPSQERRAWQWGSYSLLCLFGLTLGSLAWWWVLWWCGMLLLLARLWWWQTQWPSGLRRTLRFAQGRWWAYDLTQDCWIALPRKPLLILPRLIGVPRRSERGHYWVYQDQLRPDDWRRLRICARFTVLGATDP